MPQFLRLFLVALLLIFLSGCAIFLPYETPIQQGIQLNQSQVDKLKTGMTEDQVSYVLGTPNLIDPYHPNTWYYIYTFKANHQPMQEQKLVVYFDAQQKLTKLTGDFKIPTDLN